MNNGDRSGEIENICQIPMVRWLSDKTRAQFKFTTIFILQTRGSK